MAAILSRPRCVKSTSFYELIHNSFFIIVSINRIKHVQDSLFIQYLSANCRRVCPIKWGFYHSQNLTPHRVQMDKLRNNCYHVDIKCSIVNWMSFYPRVVLASGHSRCLCMTICVCLCVCEPWACLRGNLSPVQARTTILGQKMQNTFIKIPVNFRVDWFWPSWSHLTWKFKFHWALFYTMVNTQPLE